MRIFVVRHAEAGSRHDWTGCDRDRPLSSKGWDRANTLATVLGDRGIGRLLSSPYLRCTQTFGPLASTLGLTIEDRDALAEGAPLASGIDLIEQLVADGVPAAVCSHGDVIPELLGGLARRGTLVDSSGRCPKGSVWVLTAVDGEVTQAIYTGKSERPAD